MIRFLLALTLIGFTAHAQTKAKKAADAPAKKATAPAKKAEAIAPSEGPLKFNVDYDPAKTDDRPTINFNNGKGSAVYVPSVNDSLSEEEPFKAFIGYPKHQLGAAAVSKEVSANWNYNGQGFNFRSSTVGYNVFYNFVPTTQWTFGVDYSHYELESPEATVTPFVITKSSESYDDYYFKGTYCFINKATFFQRLCPGFVIGNDAYPVLKFVSGTALEMGKVQDIIVGVNIGYQLPFSDSVLFKMLAGYNHGSGVGNQGELTPKENSSLYFNALGSWAFTAKDEILVGGDYKSRNAKLRGLVGANKDNWTTKATEIGYRIGYQRTF